MEEPFDGQNEEHRVTLKGALANPSPELRANPLSKAFFSWVTPIFRLARKRRKKEDRELEQEDLWDLLETDNTAGLTERFSVAWNLRVKRKVGKRDATLHDLTSGQAESILMWSIWSVIRAGMYVAGAYKFVGSSLQFLYPLFINQILLYIQQLGTDDLPWWYGYAFAIGFGLAMVLKALVEGQYFFFAARSGWQTRSIITTEVYRKALRLSASARQTMTLGQIVNIMQLDSTKIEMFIAMGFHVVWDAFYQILGYMVILYLYIGWAAFVGLGVMVIAVPIQGLIFAKVMSINKKMVKVTDNRVKLTNEVLQGMLGIKMAGWEKKYTEVINSFRAEEMKFLKRMMYLSSFSVAYIMATPAIVAVAALSVYAVSKDGFVDAATLFTALTAFNQLRLPLMFLPNALNQIALAKVSRKRIADFFALDEVSHAGVNEGLLEDANRRKSASKRPVIVKVEDGEFYWQNPADVKQAAQTSIKDKKSKDKKKTQGDDVTAVSIRIPDNEEGPEDEPSDLPALTGINLEVREGELVGIVGPVGSGKTSLIGSILSELHCSKGAVAVGGSVAYAAQTAWIFNDTVRANILFGEPMDEKRYRKVLKVCQLMHDLDVLQDGDMTMIGERGINLSGGQKQRISVARAAYSRKEIVILDDPLSALDPEVARKMFTQCIDGFLKERTRILVTNQLNFLPKCDKVIVLEAKENEPGRIVEQGRYSKLLSSGMDFANLMAKFHGGSDSDSESAADPQSQQQEDTEGEDDQFDVLPMLEGGVSEVEFDSVVASASSAEQANDAANKRLSTSSLELNKRLSSALSDAKDVVNKNEGKDIMQVEERAKGAVALSEYLGYLKSGGGYCLAFFVFILFLISQFANIMNTAWVSLWSDDNQYERFTFEFYLIGYAGTAIILAIVTYIRSIGMFIFGIRAATKLHSGLIDSVMHAPTSFFDTTPIGRVVSRFSKDLFLIDTQVPMFFSFFLFTATFVIFSMATISFSTPLFLIAIPFVGIFYFWYLGLYRPLARDSKRLESISRSPVFAHFSETLGGLSTIRSYAHTSSFMEENARKVDENIKGWYLVKVIERWLSIRLEVLGAAVTIVAAGLAVYAAEAGALTAGFAGLSLGFAISITNLLNQTVRSFAELEAGMNSVERVLHYSNNIEQEAPFESKKPPPKNWPSSGELQIRNLSMRYRHDTPLVLKNVNLTIKAGERVGVCGRTGSGKSSLLLCLLRLVEPEPLEDGSGPITFDGIDTSKIGLHELRSKISIVPQSPVLFSGTVRSNLDPFNAYPDEKIRWALEQCGILSAVEDTGGLDGEVSEYGENFSQGQRQLLCLARSILNQAKLLLLDEATSSVDYETDAAIQKTIRDSFSDCTIITIAHRLNTVIDSDKILVLNAGRVAEFASPGSLLSKSTSEFSSMVDELGPRMAATLRTQAKH